MKQKKKCHKASKFRPKNHLAHQQKKKQHIIMKVRALGQKKYMGHQQKHQH
jgi:hypothetical protein